MHLSFVGILDHGSSDLFFVRGHLSALRVAAVSELFEDKVFAAILERAVLCRFNVHQFTGCVRPNYFSGSRFFELAIGVNSCFFVAHVGRSDLAWRLI
jgi:hypothetical protein